MNNLRQHLANEVAAWPHLGHYPLVTAFVLRNGVEMAPRARIGPKRPNRQCFKNAAEFVMARRLAGDDSCRYAEGFAISAGLGIPIHHAWVEIDGEAMDPTWAEPGQAYYGLPVEWQVHADEMLRRNIHGVLVDEIGLPNLPFIERMDPELMAHANAWAAARETTLERA